MKSFFNNLFGKKPEPPKIQKRNEPVRQNESQHEADDFYKKGDLIGGEYEVRGTLGKGGFGHVYLVRHCKLEVVYALKTFRDEFLDDPKARDLFKKEVLLWINLEDHPFILSAKMVLEISGRLFVFMEYIAPNAQGRVNLADHLVQTVGPLDTKQILKWAIQFCLGMEHAGAHGIQCHRDIKPANILITQDGTLRIGDFGLSRAAETAWCQSHSHNGSLIKGSGENSFSLMQSEGKFRSGTPGYIAPEVYRFEGADIRSDIYSFGLVLWQMIAGSRVPPFMVPWCGDMESFLQEIYKQQMTGHAPRMKGPLVLVIDRCLRPNPSERFGSFRELRKVLEPIFEETTGRKFKKPQLGMQTVSFWSNKGISFAALKRYEEALDCYDRALQIDPQSPVVWDNKGNALLNLGRYTESLDCYDKALTIIERIVLTGLSDGVYASLKCFAESRADPKAIWNNKGIALEHLGRLQEAITCYDSALAFDPKNMGTWSNKGNALKQLGRLQEAVICFDKALAIDSRLLNALTGKATVLCELGLQKEAVSCFDKALAINPQGASIWTLKGAALHVFGQHKDEMDCYNKAIEVDPQDASAWGLKGALLDELGQCEEAIGYYNKSLTIDPRNAIVWNNKGNALCKLGRSAEAIECYDKALTINQ
jgi:tetratricopeptide (TPR) repeat protein